jgi:hypothetical protein
MLVATAENYCGHIWFEGHPLRRTIIPTILKTIADAPESLARRCLADHLAMIGGNTMGGFETRSVRRTVADRGSSQIVIHTVGSEGSKPLELGMPEWLRVVSPLPTLSASIF